MPTARFWRPKVDSSTEKARALMFRQKARIPTKQMLITPAIWSFGSWKSQMPTTFDTNSGVMHLGLFFKHQLLTSSAQKFFHRMDPKIGNLQCSPVKRSVPTSRNSKRTWKMKNLKQVREWGLSWRQPGSTKRGIVFGFLKVSRGHWNSLPNGYILGRIGLLTELL